ncbi:MAG: hypothetical protein K6U74_05675 [Firmicutes bacterium]|nr:hypothetical protein [Bacillota bacterium]
MMTITGRLSALRNLFDWFKRTGRAGSKEEVNHYPLYRLAPSRDLGVRRVRLSSISDAVLINQPDSVKDHNHKVFHYPKPGKFMSAILTLCGLESEGRRKPVVRVAKIEGAYYIEQGQQWLALAVFLRREYICAGVVEYDYSALKKKMRIFRYPEGIMVGVANGKKGSYSYHGVSPADLNHLLKRHRIVFEDRTAVSAGNFSAKVNMARAGATTTRVRSKPHLKLVTSK